MPEARRNPPAQTRTATPRTRTAERVAERVAERTAARPIAQPIALPRSDTDAATAARTALGLQMDAAVATAGRAGETNITIEKSWVEVDGHLPAQFTVTTRDGHGLDVVLEQRAYKKHYSGTGALQTGLTPIAAIGTQGKLLVTDTTTGETLEQPWTWRSRGGLASGLWAAIKRLFWKG